MYAVGSCMSLVSESEEMVFFWVTFKSLIGESDFLLRAWSLTMFCPKGDLWLNCGVLLATSYSSKRISKSSLMSV